MISYVLLLLFIIFIDQFSKFFVLSSLEALPYEVNQYFTVSLAMNRGLMSGIFHSDHSAVFIFITSLIILFVLGLLAYTIDRFLRGYFIFAESIILGGAISNIIDRIVHGGVIDYIEIHYKNLACPIFNIADACIVMGVGLLLWYSLRGDECLA